MKKLIALIITLIAFQFSFGQNASVEHDKCIQKLTEQKKVDDKNVLNKYFEPLPKGVYFACADHMPSGRCKAHKKQCISACNCTQNYEKESKNLEQAYKIKFEACEMDYKVNKEKENATQSQNNKNSINSKVIVKIPTLQITGSNQTNATQQLQQTANYANNHVGLPQTKPLTESIRDFGTALQNYQASRQRERENRQNRRLEENQKAADFIYTLSDNYMGEYFTSLYLSKFPSYGMETTIEPREYPGLLDSINYYYKHNQYEEATHLLTGTLNTIDDISSSSKSSGISGLALRNIQSLFVFSLYLNRYDYDYKKRETLKKDLTKNKCSSMRLLGAGISSLFYKSDTTFASFCFNELIKKDSSPYFKKSAYIFLGYIKKNQGITNNNNDLLKESFVLLDKAYSISKSDFLNIGNSYSDGEYTDNYSGLFVYPEYNQILQIVILQEISNCLHSQYKITHDEKFLTATKYYYYNFINSIK